ncbi:MAG: DUF1439 domain-containing protein [Comamonadaceae bacterium]|nr:MAG: DUF1439 domain-containing protein [Comamonadaceae bacterium]
MANSGRLALAGVAAMGGAMWLLPREAHAQPSYPVAAADLQAAVAERFPRAYPVAGFLEIKVQPPLLRLLPEQNRLGVQMPVEVAGPAFRRAYPGTFDLDFALRYEASDLSIRAHELRVNTLKFEGLGAQPSALLSAYGPQLAQEALQDVILHQLKPQDLALPDGMGLQPGSITVTAKGLTIGFVTKPRP